MAEEETPVEMSFLDHLEELRWRIIKSVIAIGGGSVIDTGKAVSALVTNEEGVENYLEG